MTRSRQFGNLLAVCGGFAAFAAAMVLLWRRMFAPSDLLIMAIMYLSTALGITLGFHRLLAHRAFETYPALRYLFALLGSLAVQGPVIEWVSDHRKHHACADSEGDPHSPHVGYGGSWRGALRGLWHAHAGWLFHSQGGADRSVYSRDLLKDKGMVLIDRLFGVFVVATFVLPFALGFILTGTMRGAWTGLFWGGFVRVFLIHHVTFSVNSLCHCFGDRPFRVDDMSGNVFWLSLPTLGESWHHNHHAFPRSAFHGLRWWEIDITGLAVRGLGILGLAWNVVEIPAETQQQKACLS
jgi:stearoyl-CoA desaturase (delta-9 desaturase)